MFRKGAVESVGPTAGEDKVEPIPRHLPSASITLNFTTRSWEELAPGQLLYCPLQQTPKYMFDQAMKNQFGKFKGLWHTMEIHTPSARISDLIMLQDDLRVQSNTPTDATAFTQVVYILEYTPKGQKQYFKLTDHPIAEDMTNQNTLTYEFGLRKAAGDDTPSQLIEIQGFTDFEKLGIQGAKANLFAGFDPSGVINVRTIDQTILDPYIAPTAQDPFAYVSGNLRPKDSSDNYIDPTYSLTMAKNQDKISFYKYNDSFNIPIHTNIEGFHLANHPANDFLVDQTYDYIDPDTKVRYTYATEFGWPSRNRPFLSRKQYYTSIDPLLHGKDFKHLPHTFLAMPPIKKPNGALLGQRCSFILEQHMSVTFHMNQSTFFKDEEDDALQVNQDNQIILRRNIYPTPTTDAVVSDSIYCGKREEQCDDQAPPNKKQKLDDAAPKKCYASNFLGLTEFLNDNKVQLNTYISSYDPTEEKPADAYDVTPICDVIRTGDKISYRLNFISIDANDKDNGFRKAWQNAINTNTKLKIWMKDPFKFTSGACPILVAGNYVVVTLSSCTGKPLYLEFDVNDFLAKEFFPKTNTKCVLKQSASVPDKTCNLFFV